MRIGKRNTLLTRFASNPITSCVGGVVISIKEVNACLSVHLDGKRRTSSQAPSFVNFFITIGESGYGALCN